MKSIIKKFYLSSFYVITLLFSGLLLTLHFAFKTVGDYSVSFPQLAPTLAVIVIAIVLKDNSELNRIKEHLRFHKFDAKWAILALLLSFVFIVPSSLFLTLLGIPFVSWNGSPLFYLLNIIAMFVGCFAEEMGWRGFLLPNLQVKYSPFISSIIIGILWGIWHFNFSSGIWGCILFTLTCIEMSIIMTWIFNKTNSNLILMVQWHFLINLLSHIFLWNRFGLLLYIVESIVFGITCAVVVITDRKAFLNKPVPSKCAYSKISKVD